MIRLMNPGRCGSVISSAFSCLVIFAILSIFTVEAGPWDTAAAHQAFLEAEKEYGELRLQPDASISRYLHCAQTYRKVYFKDPHYLHAADAVYHEGSIYQKIGDLFDEDKYCLLAVKRLNFLVSNYGGNKNCPDALLKIGEIYTIKLNNVAEAQNAYRILGNQYKHSKVHPPPILSGSDPEAALKQPETTKRRMEVIPAEQKSTVRSIRHWSSSDYTRLVIDMDSDTLYEKELLHNPERMYFDIANSTLSEGLDNRTISIQDKFLKQVRVTQNNPDIVRIVLDFSSFSACAIFKLQDPFRIVIDLHNHPSEQAKITKPQPVQTAQQVTAQSSGVKGKPDAESQAASPAQFPAKASLPKSIAQDLSGKTVPLGNLIQKDLPDTPKAAEPTSYGKHTLTRMLGLKIGRIVLDPGHGGHDLGTVGSGGLLEKDLTLSLAFKLQKMLEQKLNAEVILTRDKDVFVSLEERTDIANRNRADLFISIHANSSPSRSISGVETYYLDFAKSESEREVAARENAGTGNSISDLENLVKQIARAEKSDESKELASIIQNKLYLGAQTIFSSTRDRGVRRAPFVVLIGANMPSILTEVAFISNPKDETVLNKERNRNQLADALFSGIEAYMKNLGSYPIAYRTVPNK
jgi:N-acetylmuramoyl-L-alanine amidase